MGAVFCAVSQQKHTDYVTQHQVIQSKLKQLEPWLPFVPEFTHCWSHHNQAVSLRVWETHTESARGSYIARNKDGHACLVYTGWVREQAHDSLDESVATHLLRECQRRDNTSLNTSVSQDLTSSANALEILQHLKGKSGQFAGVYITSQGQILGFHDGFCGQHLYVGQKDDTVIFSNRASLVALYLSEGASMPTPRVESLIWHVSRHESPLGDSHSAWHAAHLSFPTDCYIAYQGRLENTHHFSAPVVEQSWDGLFDRLVDRAKQVKRFPHVKFSLPLTGGLDSRLILGALIRADALSSVDHFWLLGTETQADVRAARHVADCYDLPLQVYDSHTHMRQQEQSFLTRVKRHLFHVEYMINAWDLKVTGEDLTMNSQGILPGHYGELYKGHALPILSASHYLLKKVYQSSIYMDRHHVFSKKAIQQCMQTGYRWVDQKITAGLDARLVLDELHKEARMCRWVSQTQMFEGLGYPSINLLTDTNLRAKYMSLTLQERQQCRVHFELLRRVDDRLWTLPYAGHQWNQRWVKALGLATHLPRPQAPCQGAGGEESPQMYMWRKECTEITDFLRTMSHSSEFYEFFDRHKIEKKIRKTLAHPHPQSVKGLLGLSAIKVALEEPLYAYPLKRA